MIDKLRVGGVSQIRKYSIFRKYQLDYAPRWIILMMDVILVALVFTFGQLLKFSILENMQVFENFWLKGIFFVAIYTIFIVAFRTYSGIIRYSSVMDVFRLLLMSFSASITIWFLHVIGGHYFLGRYSFLMLIVNAVLVVGSQFFMRLCIRAVYATGKKNDSSKTAVAILGGSQSTIMTAITLKAEPSGKYLPLAILDYGQKAKGQNAGGIPVCAIDKSNYLQVLHKVHANTVLVTAEHFAYFKQELADISIENGIKILMVRNFEQYNPNGTVDSKQIHRIAIEDLLERDPIRLDNKKLYQNLSGKTILVTGAAGSIGSEIATQCALFGAKRIILFDQAETPLHNLYLSSSKQFSNVDLVPFIGDVTSYDRLRLAFGLYHPDIVFHAAAYKHVPMMEVHPCQAVAVNVLGTKNVADISLEYKAERFVMVSTDKAVNPTNIMGATKRIAEMYIQSLNVNLEQQGTATTHYITTRFGNVLGSNGSVVPLFKRQISNGGPITVTDKRIIRYFMTIPEACNLVLEAGCNGEGGHIYIFDMGEPVKIYDMAVKMIKLSGLVPDQDIKIVETGLRPGEKLYEELLNNEEETLDTYHSKIKIAKVKEVDKERFDQLIISLLDYAAQNNRVETVYVMKQIVPEFISTHSIYEQVDKRIAGKPYDTAILASDFKY